MRFEREMTTQHVSTRAHLDLDLVGIQGQRELRLLRLSAMSLAALLAFATVWIIPWVPLGMGPSDVNLPTVVALVLVAALGIGAAGIALRWAPLFTDEPKSELFRALLGEPLSVRGKVRFLNRLRFQCEEGLRGRNKVFSLAVVQLPPLARGTPEGEGVANSVLAEVRQLIRTADVLGDSEDRETWVLLTGAGPHGADSACGRIASALLERSAIRAEEQVVAELRIGWANFEVDGRDPETLLRVARFRASGWTSSAGEEAAA